MPKKKVEAKEVKPDDITSLSFFECQEVINQINIMASESEGEISDEQIAALVAAQTQSITKLVSMCNFVKLIESKITTCKTAKKEINESQKHAEGILDRIESRLAEWVEAQGKSYHAGRYELKSRRSKSVQLIDGFDNAFFCTRETFGVVTPDKKKIKEALESGEEVPGAELIEKVNLTIK